MFVGHQIRHQAANRMDNQIADGQFNLPQGLVSVLTYPKR